jgi:4-hydroxythreonine-4-phosphate dehydrogenase
MLLLTPGEPAGIGPELVIRLAAQAQQSSLCAIADPALMQRCADRIGVPVEIVPISLEQLSGLPPPTAGKLAVLPQAMPGQETPGQPQTRHAAYVLQCLDLAVDLCRQAPNQRALVTGPVHKAVINSAGFRFSGHTEHIGHRCQVAQTVMMLADDRLRVALLTTHIPLHEVPAAITASRLRRSLNIIVQHCRQRLGISHPRIRVLGLNPHAGEGGYLGREEIDVMVPVLRDFPDHDVTLQGPLPADTAFGRNERDNFDVILAMYHDQGLTPLKAESFGRIVNITLGLPIVRTSVDHGTALDLAALSVSTPTAQRARLDSLQAAVAEAQRQLQSLQNNDAVSA